MKPVKLFLSITFCLLFLGLPIFLVFRPLFSPGHLSLGDAPYFYPEGAKELFNEPFAWTNRGQNLGGVNQFLWLSPLMFLWGALSKFLYWDGNLIIRLLFYWPSLALSLIGPYLLVRHWKLPWGVGFLSSLMYVLNTYYLTIVDGGVIGVALAYGLFPLTLWSFIKAVEQPKDRNILLSVILFALNLMADPRLAVISLMTAVLLAFGRRLWVLIPVVVACLGISMYWLYPLIKLGGGIFTGSFGVSSITLRNALFFYAPHFPVNEFGKTVSPPIYMILFLLLVLVLPLLLRSKLVIKLFLTFLVFAFLVKGGSFPLGEIYNFILRLPLGVAFRDATKFFTPLMLLGGILIGLTTHWLTEKIRYPLLKYLPYLGVYLLIIIAIWPAFSGRMNFVLALNKKDGDYRVIASQLVKQNSFFRTLWFPQRHPLGYATEIVPGLDAKDLVNKEPFSHLNVGGDVFNYLNRRDYLTYFRLLGIKYLILDQDPRKVSYSANDLKDKAVLEDLITNNSRLKPVGWGARAQVFENSQFLPRMFLVDKIDVVIGPMISPISGNYPPAVVYVEDGQWDPRVLEKKDASVVDLVFNNRETVDFEMSLLKSYFRFPRQYSLSQWSVWGKEDYLTYKWELLTRGLDYQDFDYGGGIAFSTVEKEKLAFNFKVKKKGEYYLAVRAIQTTKDSFLEIDFNQKKEKWGSKRLGSYEWYLSGPVDINRGTSTLSIVSSGKLSVVNVVALIPEAEYLKAQKTVQTYLGYYQTAPPVEVKAMNPQAVVGERISPVKYRLDLVSSIGWVILTETYHPDWQLLRGVEYFSAVPISSLVNGFYIDPEWGRVELIFTGQKYIRWGVYYSAISVLLIAIIFLSSGTIKK